MAAHSFQWCWTCGLLTCHIHRIGGWKVLVGLGLWSEYCLHILDEYHCVVGTMQVVSRGWLSYLLVSRVRTFLDSIGRQWTYASSIRQSTGLPDMQYHLLSCHTSRTLAWAVLPLVSGSRLGFQHRGLIQGTWTYRRSDWDHGRNCRELDRSLACHYPRVLIHHVSTCAVEFSHACSPDHPR